MTQNPTSRRKAGGVDFDRLVQAVDDSIRTLETPRQNRVDAIREYCGAHYADGGSEKVVPTNLLELATTIYVYNLVSGTPRATVSTKVHQLRPFAKTMECVLNQLPEEIGLKDTLQRCVLEALFSVAVVKIGISPGREQDEPFVDIVSLDNYFCDMTAKNRRQIQFEGNTYWMDLEDARRLYRDRELEMDEHATDQDGVDTADSITSDESASTLRDRIMLRDVYIHDTGRLVTYAVTQRKLLRDVQWDGPDAIAHWWRTYLASKPVQISLGIEKDDIHQNLRNLSAIAPEVDLLRGRNWWGGKVMDAQTERLPTTEQVDFRTSILSAALAPVFGQSPAKFEYWANQHLGGFYGMVGTSLTNIAHPGRMGAHGDLSTLPVVGALFTPRNRNDLESGFFSRAEELKTKDATKTMTLDEFAEQIAVDETKDRLSDFYKRKAAARSAVKGGGIDYTALKREEDEVNDRVREIIREHNRHVKEDDLREKAIATAVCRIGNPATKEDTVDTLASMLVEEVTLDEARSVLLRELRKKYGRLPPSTKKQCSRLVQAYARVAAGRPPSVH